MALNTEKVDAMFGWSKKFFGLPLEVKQLAPHPPSGAHHRGYSAPGREQVKHLTESDSSDGSATIKEPADMKESFESGRDDDPRMPNIWLPEGTLPGLKEACMDFYWTCYQVELTILRALALGLNAPEDYFDQYHTAADNQLRLLHYPSVPADELRNERLGRIGAHSDFCTLTLLLQDDVGGLEVEDPNKPGTFLPVPPIPGSLVVNVGDFLMRWSNDTVRSTIHRVRSPMAASSIQDGMARERYLFLFGRPLDRRRLYSRNLVG
ncbi:hypothetical protein ONZ45_g11357 [Pleurotus djamor]|nr:hypothetical protein ONZ45_g11357 [Pleurotus djamor]